MDISKVLGVIGKGVGVIETLYKFKEDATPAIKVVAKLISGAQAGPVTNAELDDTEATLDAMIADFNAPIP